MRKRSVSRRTTLASLARNLHLSRRRDPGAAHIGVVFFTLEA
jgi:hypothetical protein